MNELFHWGGHPVVQRLGWTLVHFLWQGAVIAALFSLVQMGQAKRSNNARYWTGCVCLLLMLAAPTVTYLVLGADRMAEKPLSTSRPQLEDRPFATSARTTVPTPFVPDGNDSPHRAAVPSPNPDLNLTPSTALHSEEFIRIFVLVWFVGVSVLSLRLLFSSLQIARLKRRDNEPLGEPWMTQVHRLKAALQISRPVRLVKSVLVEVPTVVGWLRPVILLPAASLMGLTTGQLESILAHELAHIRRHDYLVNLLQNVLETLLFYHPAVRWISNCVRAEREICCDEIAVRLCGDRLVYAQALTTLEELRGAPTSLALGASGGSLLERIRRLSGAPSGEAFPNRRRAGGAIVAALVALIFIFLLHYPSENAKGQTGDIARELRPSQGAFLKGQQTTASAENVAAQKPQGSQDNEGNDVVFSDLALQEAICQLASQEGLKVQFDPPWLLLNHEIPHVNEKWKMVTADQALQALLINYCLEMERSPGNPAVRIHAKKPDALGAPVAEVSLLGGPPPNGSLGTNLNNNDEVIDLEIHDVPLPDAIRTLADQISLNIQFDPALLKQNAPHVNEPLKKVSTRHAIQELLDKYGWRLTRIPENPILRVVASHPISRLPNGTELSLLAVTHGPSNLFFPDGPEGEPMTDDWRKLDGTLSFSNKLVLWIGQRGPSGVPPLPVPAGGQWFSDLRATLADEKSEEWDTRMTLSDPFQHENLRERNWVFPLDFSSFPRRGKTLRFRFYVRNDSDAWDTLADFTFPNPVPGPYPIWKPASLPALQTNGNLLVSLISLTTGAKPLAYHFGIRPFTRATFDVKVNGQPTDAWEPDHIEPADATGNEPWWPAGSHSATNGLPYYEMDGVGLSPSEVWRVRARFARTGTPLWTSPELPMREDSLLPMSLSTNVQSLPLTLSCEQSRFPNTIVLKAAGLPANAKLGATRILDDQGRPAKYKSGGFSDFGFDAQWEIPFGAKWLKVSVTLSETRTFDFLAKPTAIPETSH
ncbi:MAG: M56 family metallopeptidase [Limisphaerales bacterium]